MTDWIDEIVSDIRKQDYHASHWRPTRTDDQTWIYLMIPRGSNPENTFFKIGITLNLNARKTKIEGQLGIKLDTWLAVLMPDRIKAWQIENTFLTRFPGLKTHQRSRGWMAGNAELWRDVMRSCVVGLGWEYVDWTTDDLEWLPAA